jgi:hypothetical protein
MCTFRILPVEASRAQQRRVQDVGPVRRRHDDYADVGFETVHLDEHLVQRLFALVIASAQACATVPADGVDFVDEDDAGRALLRLLEHVANARGAHADEHFDEVRSGDREERHFRFAGDRLGEQRLAGSRRADEQHTARDASAELLEFLRVFQEVDEFLDFLFRLVAAGDVGKRRRIVRLVEHSRLALAEAECPTLATALHLAHEIDPDADQEQDRAP